MISQNYSVRRPKGMRGIYVIWLGQMISGIASSITFFALPAWILENTDISGNALGPWEAIFFGSYLAVVLFAGVLIDRYSRKMMMLVYDFMSLTAITILLVLQATDSLAVWHLYVAAIIQGVGFAFQAPSYAAAITTMVSRKQYLRANGIISLLDNAPGIFGPILALTLIRFLGLTSILGINLLAYVISIGALLFVEIPPSPHTEEGERSHTQFLREAMYGIRYIFRRPGLLGVQLVFFFGNLFSGIALSVTALYTMISLRTGGDPTAAGAVQSIGNLAAVLAGVYLSTLGGIKRPIRAILWGWIFSSLLGLTLLGIGRFLLIWLIAVIIDSVFEPIVNVSIDTLLQTKVPPDLQGRVFSASDFLAQAMIPVAPLLAGFFGERVFEPAMAEGGALVPIFGWLVGTGPGAGFGLLILLCGVGGTLVGLSAYLVPIIRDVDKILPDFQPLPPVELGKREQPLAPVPSALEIQTLSTAKAGGAKKSVRKTAKGAPAAGSAKTRKKKKKKSTAKAGKKGSDVLG